MDRRPDVELEVDQRRWKRSRVSRELPSPETCNQTSKELHSKPGTSRAASASSPIARSNQIGDEIDSSRVHGSCRGSATNASSSKTHTFANGTHRFTRQRPTPIGSARQRVIDFGRRARELGGATSNRHKLRFHRLGQHLLAIDASPTSRTALRRDVFNGRRRAERFVKVIDVTDFWCPRIRFSDSL
jgi:hypothetical protein